MSKSVIDVEGYGTISVRTSGETVVLIVDDEIGGRWAKMVLVRDELFALQKAIGEAYFELRNR